jgi:hypothetical protein
VRRAVCIDISRSAACSRWETEFISLSLKSTHLSFLVDQGELDKAESVLQQLLRDFDEFGKYGFDSTKSLYFLGILFGKKRDFAEAGISGRYNF